MKDYWINFGLSIVFGMLKESIKNPESKEKFKRAMLKLHRQILRCYADDPDFSDLI